jgi:DNA invertase Pin-like site-specific DNA recombinase
MRVIGYVRVSTYEQANNGSGIDAQRETLKREAEQRGWEVEWMTDAGYSAKNLKRPGIQRALEMLKRGDAEGLAVAKLDRLSRSVFDFAGLMQKAQRQGWAIVALDLGVDTTTPAGEAMANVLATFAQFERRMIGVRTKEALAVKRAQGVEIGRPSALSERHRRLIRKRRQQGKSYPMIAAELNAKSIPTSQGGTKWRASSVRAVCVSAR